MDCDGIVAAGGSVVALGGDCLWAGDARVFIWAIPILYRNFKALLASESGLVTGVLAGFVAGSIALFFGITYLLGTDLTRGARYNFVYFPAVIVLVGAMLSVSWNSSNATYSAPKSGSEASLPNKPKSSRFGIGGKRAVALIWLMGFLSAVTVVNNLGYQKYYRPDLLLQGIQKASSVPILIATTHNTLVQTGEMMGIAWEFRRSSNPEETKPQFLLAHQAQDRCEGTACPAAMVLQQAIAQMPRPLDLWLVNFKAPVNDPLNCFTEDVTQYLTAVDGYAAKLYHCLAADS